MKSKTIKEYEPQMSQPFYAMAEAVYIDLTHGKCDVGRFMFNNVEVVMTRKD